MKTTKKQRDLEWSDKVKERAGHKCELCDKTNRLSSHHIVSRNIYAVRWDINNGACVCVSHHIFGKESAHQNPVFFLDKLIKLRNKRWFNRLLKKSLLKKEIK